MVRSDKVVTSYWEAISKPIRGNTDIQSDSDILVIGSGFTGASAAYHLAKNSKDYTVSIVDNGVSCSFSRNAGHVLCGMAEHYYCQVEHWGKEKAMDIVSLSVDFMRLNKEIYPAMEGSYAAWAMNDSEDETIDASHALLLDHFGYNIDLSRRGNPVVNRNNLMMLAYNEGVNHFESEVENIYQAGSGYMVEYKDGELTHHNAVVVCTNAYTKLLLEDTSSTLEPFKGQIIVSQELDKELIAKLSDKYGDLWSFDNGFIYGQFINDRILIGGWRNNISGREIGSLDLTVNEDISNGLKEFVADRMDVRDISWDFEWTGVMASTPNGLPIVRQRSVDGLYIAAGMNGYGHSWAPGCGREVANMVLGLPVNPTVLKYFRGD